MDDATFQAKIGKVYCDHPCTLKQIICLKQ